MKSFEEQLKNWNDYFNLNRQVGHTHTAINGVINNRKSALVCATECHRRLYPKIKTINFQKKDMSIQKMPVVFDNFTVHLIIQKSLYERIDKIEVCEAIDKKLKFLNHILKQSASPSDQLVNQLGVSVAIHTLNELLKELGLDK